MHMSSTPTLSLLSLMQISLSLSLFKMLGAERVGQQLLHSHNLVVSLPIVHVHWEGRRGELANELSTHPTRRRRRLDICRDSQSLEIFVAGDNSSANGHALSAGSNWIRSIFDISAGDELARCREDACPDTEFGVWAWQHISCSFLCTGNWISGVCATPKEMERVIQ